MDLLRIEGGPPLNGDVRASGAKNATLPIMTAALLIDEPLLVENVPHLEDVTTTNVLLAHMGVSVTIGDYMVVEADASTITRCVAPYDLVKTMRASILVLGPLLARHGEAEVSLPGVGSVSAEPSGGTIEWRGVAVVMLLDFVFYTAATGPFESLIQRAIFLALVVCLGLAVYPLGHGRRWRPLGLVIDLATAGISLVACGYIVVNYDEIMTNLPWATSLDMVLTAGLVISVLEVSRRAVGIIFPVLVVIGLTYALLGNHLPGALAHRGFDGAFVTETIFLGDLGIWGMLTGVAATLRFPLPDLVDAELPPPQF